MLLVSDIDNKVVFNLTQSGSVVINAGFLSVSICAMLLVSVLTFAFACSECLSKRLKEHRRLQLSFFFFSSVTKPKGQCIHNQNTTKNVIQAMAHNLKHSWSTLKVKLPLYIV